MPKVRVDNLEIPYAVSYRNIRYPRLEFRTGDLLVVMPKSKRDAKKVIERHKLWIKQKKNTINVALLESKKRKLVQRSDTALRKIVSCFVIKFKSRYGFEIKRTYFRKMNSKWASHSTNKNLTFNSALKYLPKNVIEYVVFHEMAHAVERKHNARFWKIVERRFSNYQKMEKELTIYWFLMQKNNKKELIRNTKRD